jgi:hypothetical protein
MLKSAYFLRVKGQDWSNILMMTATRPQSSGPAITAKVAPMIKRAFALFLADIMLKVMSGFEFEARRCCRDSRLLQKLVAKTLQRDE